MVFALNEVQEVVPMHRDRPDHFPARRRYRLICTTFAGGKPLKQVDEA
jgi:hypothetical protein